MTPRYLRTTGRDGLIATGSDQSITLQVQHLAVAIRRDAYVANQHVRKTSLSRFPHNAPFRQGLSHIS
jgi:hypothetical protein